MTSEQDTDNPARLPLAERARRGLLAAESELSLSDLASLEHPSDAAARWRLEKAIEAAIEYDDLAARPVTHWIDYSQTGLHGQAAKGNGLVPHEEPWINRDSYRTWRAQCPENLLSPLSQVHKWLGATPALVAQGEQCAASALSDKDIKALRETGMSVDAIHKQYRIPRDRIKRINKHYAINPLPRGPKPKIPD